jgi:hypothetical protein
LQSSARRLRHLRRRQLTIHFLLDDSTAAAVSERAVASLLKGWKAKRLYATFRRHLWLVPVSLLLF